MNGGRTLFNIQRQTGAGASLFSTAHLYAKLYAQYIYGTFLRRDLIAIHCAEGEKNEGERDTFSTMGQRTAPSRQLGGVAGEINYLHLNDTHVTEMRDVIGQNRKRTFCHAK